MKPDLCGFDFNIGQVYIEGWRKGMFHAANNIPFNNGSKYLQLDPWGMIYEDGYVDGYTSIKSA